MEYKKGGLIKRADGSYSKRGLWDNIRANKGSGKKPTKEMLEQEKKIKAKMKNGGVIDNPGFNALPEYVQKNIIANMAMGGYTYAQGGKIPDGGIVLKFDNSQNEIDYKTGKPTGKGGLKDASLDVVNAFALANSLTKGAGLAYDTYQFAKPGVINLSKTYYPTYGKALKETVKGMVLPFSEGGKIPKSILKARVESHMSPQEANSYLSQYAEGGIHIKPENKGKFTAWANAHNMGVQEAARHVMANKEDYSSTIVKRANFAKNAAGWKKQYGGVVTEDMYKYFNGGNISSQGGNMTGPIQLGSMAGNMALDVIPDNQVVDTEGNPVGTYQGTGKSIGKGALSGAAIGSSIIPGIGTVVGGLVGGAAGYFQGKQEEDEMKKMQADANNVIMSKRRMGGPNSPITTMPTNVNNMYPYGGTISDDQPGAIAELELQEQMQLPNGVVMGVDGPSHEQGGIEVNVPEGTKVFSDRLKLGKKTFAAHAKSINSKIAKLDNRPETVASKNTQMLFNKQLDNLFNTQEEMKAVKEETKQRKLFAKGGTIPAEHNGMYPAHNVRIMKHGGLTHYDGEDGKTGVIFNDPSVVITDPLAQFKWGMENKNSNLFPSQPNQVVVDNYGVQRPFVTKDTQSFRQSEPNNANSNYFTPQNMGYVTQGLTNLLQNQQINKVKAPRTIAPISFTAGRSPELVDYSAERAAIDAEVAAARRGVNLGSGSYSTQAANLQKIRNQQMMGKGRSFQTQENANRQLNNAYNAQLADAYNKAVQANLGIDQYNLENRQNYELWKAGNRMKSTGSMGDTLTNMINNQIARDNQLAYYEMMSRMFEPKIRKDIDISNKKYGGTIKKRSLKK